jgi:hypothetical protein
MTDFANSASSARIAAGSRARFGRAPASNDAGRQVRTCKDSSTNEGVAASVTARDGSC